MTTSSRRGVLRGAAAVGVLAAAAPALAPARAGRQPNILLILADDLRYDAVGYLNPSVRTPNLDAVARTGSVFHNAFVTTSICGASRASIQTGLYARRHQVWDFLTRLSDQQRAAAYPRLLQAAGYRTGYFGKYGIGDETVLPAPHPSPSSLGFDEYKAFEDYYPADDKERRWHHSRRTADLAEAFIAGSPAGQPFCLTLGFKAPHAKDDGDPLMGPFVAEPDMAALYAGDIFTRGATMNETAFANLPPFLQRSEARRRWTERFATPQLWADSVRKYYALVSGIDRAVGRVLQALERKGLLDDTLIVFTSDNGYFLGDYGLEGKWFGFEASIRVPLVIRTPGQSRPQRIEAPVLNIDLAPTLVEFAGRPPPADMQGASLAPLLMSEGPPRAWRTDFLYEHYLPGLYNYSAERERFLPSSEGVRNERYTYLRYPRQAGPNEMLFDRAADPHELKNIVRDADPELLHSLRKRTDQLIAQAA